MTAVHIVFGLMGAAIILELLILILNQLSLSDDLRDTNRLLEQLRERGT